MKFQPWTQEFPGFSFWNLVFSTSHFFKSCKLSLFRDSSTIFSLSYYQTKVNFYSHCVKTVCAAPSPNVSTTYDLLPFLPSNSNLQPTQTLNTVFSINVLFAHKKYHQPDTPSQVGFKTSLWNHTENSLPSSSTQLPSSLKTSHTSVTYQRGRWHLLSLLTALWQIGSHPPLSENCHPLSCLGGPGEKCQSCRAAIVLGFCYSDTSAWCFLAVRTQHPFFSFLGLQCGWEDV